MSKPWEQEWRKGGGRTGEHALGIYDEEGYCVVVVPSEEEGRFISAAPDMARALLDVASEDASLSADGMPCWCTRQGRERMRDSGIIRHEGFCDRARAALRKAGVPL